MPQVPVREWVDALNVATTFGKGEMFNKGLSAVYILIYGALLILCIIVTFSTSIGFWGIAGIVGFGWLTWREVASLSTSR